ncbi:phytanoyl-CoA dioxygenase family protein [Erythrobacter rubeus]|uniref:Phytanoyl-CoA dioxygenase family protein n=1 Tax=Erythrobacter rubeus TaxID=2760803 RepID=A0ABR8KKX5_9SPHN|nr:phytanoyl-CoA dioxygenase family protein [Erythrobacter rubeus]MBD2840983.1 phytanoyl-CoA dioxygenase family protein [Erythrobacter rubeus]
MSDQTGHRPTKSSALFPGVPFIESPIFESEELSDFSDQERALARDLNAHGFAIIDFPDTEIDARIERIKKNLGPRFDIPLDIPTADKTEGERRIQDAWTFDEDVRAIASNPKMLDLLGKLYGRRPFPFQTLNFPVGTQQAAHADAVHFSSLPERFMCGVWVAMEDVSLEAGPLFYVRGSHRWPIMTNAMIGRRGYGSELASAQDPYADAWQALCQTYQKTEEPFLARKGQALIWCANLLHGGSRQLDPTLTRWSQVTHYFFDDCIYYTPALSDETIGQLTLRNHTSVSDQKPKQSTYLGEAVVDPSRKGLRRSVVGRAGKLVKSLVR